MSARGVVAGLLCLGVVIGGPLIAAAQQCLIINGLPFPPKPVPDVVLYELTENMKLVVKDDKLAASRRLATSALMGSGSVASPVCATPPCSFNAIARDNVSLVTGTGPVTGEYTAVVQDVNPTDGPEVVVGRGTFRGQIDFTPLLLLNAPIGYMNGTLITDGAGKQDLCGIFRQPFVVPGGDSTPYYFVPGANPYNIVPVQASELALGFPTVRFEIYFQ